MTDIFSTSLAGALVASVVAASTLAAAAPAMAETPASPGIVGAWKAPFGESIWTFEFKQENGVWSGRYMSSKAQKWHDLLAVRVEGDRVRFGVEATPTLDFDLRLSGNALKGELAFGNGRSVPFIAERAS